MSVYQKIFFCHAIVGGNTNKGKDRLPLGENAILRKVLSQQDAKKIKGACNSLDRALDRMKNTRIYGESCTNRTLKSDIAEFNREIAAMAGVLKEIARQNPAAKIFKFRHVDAGKSGTDWPKFTIARKGDKTAFVRASIETEDGHGATRYTIIKFPFNYDVHVDYDKRKCTDGSVIDAIEGIKDFMTDILNYPNLPKK